MKTHSRHSTLLILWSMLMVLFALGTAPAGWAQKDMGNIVGVIKDSSGALVADAKVTVTDVDHGTTFQTTTNANGEYEAGPLKIGHYTVAVEKQGFKRTMAGPVPLKCRIVCPSTSPCKSAQSARR